MLRSKSVWLVGGALLIGLGYAVARVLTVDLDFDLSWDDLPA
jgi:hypothetical protein